jgi:hypothetical protein
MTFHGFELCCFVQYKISRLTQFYYPCLLWNGTITNPGLSSVRFPDIFLHATLRPNIIITGVEETKLEKQMQSIAWEEMGVLLHTNNTVIIWPEIQAVLNLLKELSQLPNGDEIANLLKLKFWMETELERFIPNLSVLKNHYETSLRFHFFEEDGGISLNEAYRFLCHRWKERQMNRNRKMQIQENGASLASASAKSNKKQAKGTRTKTEQ